MNVMKRTENGGASGCCPLGHKFKFAVKDHRDQVSVDAWDSYL